MPEQGPLTGLRVVDLTQSVAGPYCTKLLADYGAQVIKVEPPGRGDVSRLMGPFPGDVVDPEKSGLFLHLNTNKLGITLDVHRPGDRERLKELIATADALVEDLSPGVLASLGLAPETLRHINPRLVTTSITNFGPTGPYRDYKATDMVHFALCGWMQTMGRPDRPPLYPGGPYVFYVAGQYATIGTLLALEHAAATGVGQSVDLSILDAGLSVQVYDTVAYSYFRRLRQRDGHRWKGFTISIQPCKDGYVNVSAGHGEERWQDLWTVLLDRPQVLEDPRFTPAQRDTYRLELEAIGREALQEHTVEEMFHTGQALRLFFSPVLNVKEALECPQHLARSYFQEIDHPRAGRLTYIGSPVRLTRTPWSLRGPAPLLGQHNAQVLEEVARDRAEGAATPGDRRSEAPFKGERPRKESVLKGVRVLAFTTGWAGPMAGEVLGDFGADVIKVESCRHVDWGRGVAIVRGKGDETRDKLWEWGTTFNGANQNTRSVTLDLTTPQGKELFHRLVAVSDVVIENFAPRVLKQLGITYEQLRRINPSIIVVSMPAFGNWGPWGDYVGYAQTTESTGGVAALCGYEGESPVLQGDPYGDPLAGINGAMAALMALRHRRRTGQGQSVEVSHVEAITPHIGGPLMDYVMNGRIQPRRGNRSPAYAPHGCYRAAGDDRWVVITVTSETEWQALCSAMGRPDVVADPRFRTMKNRLANQDALDAIVQEWTSPQDRFNIMRTLQGVGVPAGPVLDAADLLANEHLAATGFFVPLHKEPVGTHPYPGIAPRLNVTPGEKRMAAPTLGEHNGEVLGALLGVSPAALRLLEEAQVIGYEPLEAGAPVPSRPG